MLASIPTQPEAGLTFDEPAIREHVMMVHQLAAGLSGKFVVAAFFSNPNGEDKAGGVISHHNVGDVDGMVDAVTAHAGTPNANVYISPNLMRASLERGRKGSESDVVAVLALVADMDEDTGRAGSMPVEPNYIVESSPGNYQCFILLDSAMQVSDAKALASALKRGSNADHCTADMAHVWRVPGTLNWPNAKKLARGRSPEPSAVTVAEAWDGSLTNVEDLRSALQPWAAGPVSASHAALGDLPSVDGVKLSAAAADMLAADDVGDRSEHAARVVEQLAFDGLTAEQACSAFLSATGNWFARYEGKDPVADFTRTWRKFGLPHVEDRARPPVTLKLKSKSSQLVAANDNSLASGAAASSPQAVPALPVVCPAEWHGHPVPVREWFIEGLIPRRQVTILAGDGGVGKSLLALQLGAASALNVDTAGFSPVPGRVLYLGAEDEADEFHRRLAEIAAGHGRSLGDLVDFRLIPMADLDALLAVPDGKGVMQPTPVWGQLCELGRRFLPSFLVLDTVADLFGGDEIKRGQARQFIGMLRRLAIEIDCSIVLLAHPSQEGIRSGSGSSGSTGWKNSSRSMLYFSRPDGDREIDLDLRILSTKKINYGKVGGETKLRWEAGCFVVEDGNSSPALGLMNRRADEVFIRLLRTFARTGQQVGASPGTNYAPAKMAKHTGAEGLTKKVLETAMQRLLEDGTIKLVWDGPPSKQRQRLMVAADDYSARQNPE